MKAPKTNSRGDGTNGHCQATGSGSSAQFATTGSGKKLSFSKFRSKRGETYEFYKQGNPELTAPGIGGIFVDSPVPENILPLEALLQVPTPAEIRGPESGLRMIFLNTPLDESEQTALQEFDEEFKKQGSVVPRCMEVHALRTLQQSKFNVKKAVEQTKKNYDFRMKYLPMREADVIADLRKGWMYWHGRDLRCRPCLVVRACNIDRETWNSPDRVTRTVLWSLEFILRYGLVPGRVENWVLIVDIENGAKHGTPSMSALSSMANALQQIYRFRMVWTKIVNAPYWFTAIWMGLKKAIPGESVKKVEIIGRNCGETLQKYFAPNQLEQRYGGSAPNVEDPNDCYPPRFPPGPCGAVRNDGEFSCRLPERTQLRAHLAELTSLALHEGALWVGAKKDRWIDTAREASITPGASQYAKETLRIDLPSCENFEQLLKILRYEGAESTSSGAAASSAKPPMLNVTPPAAPASSSPAPTASPPAPSVTPPERRAPGTWDAGKTASQASASSSAWKPEVKRHFKDGGYDGLDKLPPASGPPGSSKAAANGAPAASPLRQTAVSLPVESDRGKASMMSTNGSRIAEPTVPPIRYPPILPDAEMESLSRRSERQHTLEGAVPPSRCPFWCGCSPGKR